MENNESNKAWGINLEKERAFWRKNILNKFITPPEKCPICNKGFINIINSNSLNNPLISKCNSYKYGRTKYLRAGTFFEINYKYHIKYIFI